MCPTVTPTPRDAGGQASNLSTQQAVCMAPVGVRGQLAPLMLKGVGVEHRSGFQTWNPYPRGWSHGKCPQSSPSPPTLSFCPTLIIIVIISLLKKLLEKARLERSPSWSMYICSFPVGAFGVPLGSSPQGDSVVVVTRPRALLLDNLDDILMLHGVGQAHPLWAVLGARAPHQCILELAGQRPVDAMTHMLHRGPFPEDDGV